MRQIDGYCERVSSTYWGEPVNAVTNLAFVAVAFWLWSGARGIERLLCGLLGLIGIGSWLFHTHATVWAALSDVTPIGLFILLYVFAAHRRYFGWGFLPSLLAALAFAVYLAVGARAFAAMPGLAISAMYWPVPLAIAVYGLVLRQRLPHVARGFWIGAGVLTLSLVFRSVDRRVCDALPLGTHFVWHLLNAVMLGWMITVLRRDRLERGLEPR